MAEVVSSLEEGGRDYGRYMFCAPLDYADPDDSRAVANVIVFHPNKGRWFYETRNSADNQRILYTVYWSERDGCIYGTQPGVPGRERKDVEKMLERCSRAAL